MARLPGHKAGCRCVGCSPATRARGARAMRKAARPGRRRNPATAAHAQESQLQQKARLVLIAAAKIGPVPPSTAGVLLQLANAVAFGAAADMSSAARAALEDKGLRGKRAMHAALDRALGLLSKVSGHKPARTQVNPSDPLAAALAQLVRTTKPADGHFTLDNAGSKVWLVFVGDKGGSTPGHKVSPAQSRQSLAEWIAAYAAGYRFAKKQLQ